MINDFDIDKFKEGECPTCDSELEITLIDCGSYSYCSHCFTVFVTVTGEQLEL